MLELLRALRGIHRMPVPGPGQTVHMMSWGDVLRVRWDMHREEGRNVRELELYTTDDLRRLYQTTNDDLIQLRDGIVRRVHAFVRGCDNIVTGLRE